MNNLLLMPAVASNSNQFEYADYEEVVEQPVTTTSCVSFLDANTNHITMDELKTQCVVPTWANQELTISHQDFGLPVIGLQYKEWLEAIGEDQKIRRFASVV
jgi:hypothetical protein